MAQVVYGKLFTVHFEAALNAECVDRQFFVAPFPCQVVAVAYDHAVAGSNGSAVNLQLEKLTTTAALDAGTDLLTNNTNAGFDCKATAQTRQTGTLHATVSNLQLAAGDKLGAAFAGTVTDLLGVVMQVTLKAIA